MINGNPTKKFQRTFGKIDKWESDQKIPKDIWKKMGDQGFLGLTYPEKYGGFDLDFFFEVILFEEMSKMNSGGFVITYFKIWK